jgi:hypothetical protein
MTGKPDAKSEQRLDNVLRIIGVLILAIFVAVLPVISFTNWINSDVRSMMLRNCGPFVALPGAGVFALLVVAIFQITHGDIVFKVGTFELQGAGGPILMWIVAYFVIAISMYLLWNENACATLALVISSSRFGTSG